MFKLETAVSTWRHQYKYSRAFKGRDLDELEQHIRDQVAFLVSSGKPEEEAFRLTVAELGSYQTTESDYRGVAWMKTKDRREVLQEIKFFAAMLGSYFRIAYRNLKKNKVSSLINMFGLSLSISVCLVAFLFVSTVFTEDFFHENADEIFLVHQRTIEEDGPQLWGHSPRPLGPALAESSPQIERAVRIAQSQVNIIYGDENLRSFARFVDPEFLEMFSFPLLVGTDAALRTNDQVLLSESTSIRFFGETDPIGQVLSIRIENRDAVEFTVTGVTKEFPAGANIQFNMLMSYEVFEILGGTVSDDWSTFTAATFLQLRNADDAPLVTQQLNAYTDRVNAMSQEWQITGFELDNLKMLPRNSDDVNRTVSGGISIAPVIVLSSISILLLLLSCFNYMNVTIATSSRRLKEIGVRKVMGGSRAQLIFQFLAENIELCSVALVLGLFMTWQFTLPGFSAIAGVNFEIGLLKNYRLWGFLVVMILGTGIISGAYPAVYISGFRPAVIFQGRERLGGRRPLTQSFLTFQFMLAFLTMLSGIVFVMNGSYLKNKDWGYDGEHILVFHTTDSAEFNLIETLADQAPGVIEKTASRSAIGYSQNEVQARANDREFEAVLFGGSRSYLDFMGVGLVQGQMLSDKENRVGMESVVVNQTFVEQAGLENPVGTFINVDSTDYAIVGVFTDFHYEDFFSGIEPAVFHEVPASDFRYLTMRVQPGAGVATAEFINDEFKSVFGGREATYLFQDELFDSFFEESMGISAIFTFIATLALLISCLSIYALSSQNVVNRLKEIGVRKVLGGSSAGIAQLVNRKFFVILTIGAVLSAPFGFYGLDALLSDIYDFRMDLTAVPFLITYAIIVAMTLLTVSTQVVSINRARPADIMRSE